MVTNAKKSYIEQANREMIVKAAKTICPDQAHLVPHDVSELKILDMAMEKAFIDRQEGLDVELVREGKRRLRDQGVLQ